MQERISETHLKFTGGVEFEQGDTTLFADEVEFFTDQDRALARGNVVISQGRNRIAADRADFNTRTRLGTFYNAWGLSTIKPPPSRMTAVDLSTGGGRSTTVSPSFSAYQATLLSMSATETPMNAPRVVNGVLGDAAAGFGRGSWPAAAAIRTHVHTSNVVRRALRFDMLAR